MVDAVGTIMMQNVTLRSGSQGAAASAPAQSAPVSKGDFVTSQIYVDNLQNVAILQYRSSQTGEVVQQYPTQRQIEAFKRAEAALSQKLRQSTQHAAAPAPEHHESGASEVSHGVSFEAPAPSTPAPAPAPAPVAADTADAAPGPSSGGSGSTHSVLA